MQNIFVLREKTRSAAFAGAACCVRERSRLCDDTAVVEACRLRSVCFPARAGFNVVVGEKAECNECS